MLPRLGIADTGLSINVTSSSTVVAALEAARDKKAPIVRTESIPSFRVALSDARSRSSKCPKGAPRTSQARWVSRLTLCQYSQLILVKGVPNGDQSASIAGAIAGANYVRSIASSYNVPVVLHTDHCAKKLLPWLDGMVRGIRGFKGRPKC